MTNENTDTITEAEAPVVTSYETSIGTLTEGDSISDNAKFPTELQGQLVETVEAYVETRALHKELLTALYNGAADDAVVQRFYFDFSEASGYQKYMLDNLTRDVTAFLGTAVPLEFGFASVEEASVKVRAQKQGETLEMTIDGVRQGTGFATTVAPAQDLANTIVEQNPGSTATLNLDLLNTNGAAVVDVTLPEGINLEAVMATEQGDFLTHPFIEKFSAAITTRFREEDALNTALFAISKENRITLVSYSGQNSVNPDTLRTMVADARGINDGTTLAFCVVGPVGTEEVTVENEEGEETPSIRPIFGVRMVGAQANGDDEILCHQSFVRSTNHESQLVTYEFQVIEDNWGLFN